MPERFSALSERIHKTWNMRSVITWGPGERDLAERVVSGSHGRSLLSPETGSLLDLTELLKLARVVVGSDTGPLHLANAADVPSVSLFGPKDPVVYAPRSPNSRIVTKAQSNGRPVDMSEITVDDVCEKIDELLKEESRVPSTTYGDF